MRLLSWNIRGLGSTPKKRAIQRLLQQHRCEMVVLLETKLEVISDRMVVWYTDNYEYVFAPAKERAGGILIVWDLTRFRLSTKEMVRLWGALRGVLVSSQQPWCVYGDFNMEVCAKISLMHRLKSFKAFLRDWNSSSFGDVDRGITRVTKQIDELDNDCRDDMKS
ncbi:hypothetical protein V6N13_142378 [Hibiscus sabdariffa]